MMQKYEVKICVDGNLYIRVEAIDEENAELQAKMVLKEYTKDDKVMWSNVERVRKLP